jgi:hypothetical protein
MIAKPSIAFNDFSGTAKDVTARSVGGRNVLSVRAKQSQIVTPAQAVSRNNLSKSSRAYKQLSDSQIAAWEALAKRMKGISTFGMTAELTAHNAFIRINSNRSLAGMPLLSDAPVYTSDVPEVDYEDFWVTPEKIVFVGLNVPSDSYRLVMKMSRTESTGVSSGWGNTEIVAPALSPDWGDADITEGYLSTIGFLPVAGQKYFLSFWWMDTETGFTGESMMVSVICQELSAVKKEVFVARKRIEESDLASGGNVPELDLEFSPASGVVSVAATMEGRPSYASSECQTLEKLTDIPAGDSMQLARASEDGDYQPQSYAIWIRHYKEYTKITFAHRGGYYEKPSYMDSTSVFY